MRASFAAQLGAIGATSATEPDAFGTGDWAVEYPDIVWDVTYENAVQPSITVTVSDLPENGGSSITDIEWSANGSTGWTSVGGATAGSYTITGSNTAGETVYLRAVNAVGASAASASKSPTATYGPNLLTNGDFADGGTGWEEIPGGASATFTGGQASVTTSSANRGIFQATTRPLGDYLIGMELISSTGGTVTLRLVTGSDGITGMSQIVLTASSNGKCSVQQTTPGTINSVAVRNNLTGTTTVVDNVFVRAVL